MKKHARKQLQFLLQSLIYLDDFPAAEASRLILWLTGDSVVSIQTRTATEIIKAARKRLFEEAEEKWAKRRAKSKRYVDRQKAKKAQEASKA